MIAHRKSGKKMFKKTLGLFVLALMAISVTGVVYANLCIDFTMDHTIETGTVSIGILNTGTSDPRGSNDLVWDGFDFVRTHKDVANVTSDNIDAGCVVDQLQYYDKVFFNITDAYPWYVAYENFTIVNCGTIPVFINSIVLTGGTDPAGMLDHVAIWAYVTDPNTQQTTRYTDLSALEQALYGIQIDPTWTVDISIWILFLQDVPLNSKATFEFTVTACQWNEVLYPTNGGNPQ